MAPPSGDWLRLLRVQPTNVDFNNEAEEEQNENFGKLYMKVKDEYFI